MAKTKTIETRIIKVEVETPWRDMSAAKLPVNALKIRFSFNAIKKEINWFGFYTTRIGKWFAVRDIERLRAMRDLIDEAINEAEKLLLTNNR